MTTTLHEGDCLDVMAEMDDDSVDTIITDPPYGLEFMGKDWDGPNGWQAGAGFSKPGIGERDTPWPSFAGANDEFGGANPTCAKCGGRARGKRKCTCDEPDWRVKGEKPDPMYGRKRMMAQYQAWVNSWAIECLRVAKPGAVLLAFGGTRTHHRLMCAIEDAGWEIRDVVMWLYGSGFPKSHNISKAIDKAARGRPHGGSDPESPMHGRYRTQATEGKRENGDRGQQYGSGSQWLTEGKWNSQHLPATDAAALWDGWGTALKPAWEPVIVAMKPRDGTFANNALAWGVAGLWVDGGRIPCANQADQDEAEAKNRHSDFGSGPRDNAVFGSDLRTRAEQGNWDGNKGRWPANLILDEEAAAMLDEQSGETSYTGPRKNNNVAHGNGHSLGFQVKDHGQEHHDRGGASRFFYCAKASRAERNAGLEGMEEKHAPKGNYKGRDMDNPKNHLGGLQGSQMQNHHPTVKPLDLMRYLVRLTRTPTGGVVLDPFMGSGTTGMAAVMEGRDFVGIEMDGDYLEIARRRIEAAQAEMIQAEMAI